MARRNCTVPGCPKKLAARGLCLPHYKRIWHRGGFAEPVERSSDEERFWAKVGAPNANGCREWLGERDRDGYGMTRFGERHLRAHAVAWRLTYQGPTIPNPVFRHSCDTPSCAEASHSYPGTQKENAADCVAKGRSSRGERSGNAKLTAMAVLEIRQALASGEAHSAIAACHGVGKTTVTAIGRRQNWGWLA